MASNGLAFYLKLVFTILAILSSIGIVSPRDELEHSLDPPCEDRCMKT